MPLFTGLKFGFGAFTGSAPVPFSASGGTQIIDGANTYHVFADHASPATFVTNASNELEILVVAGGGGNSGPISGGGGAGGIAHAVNHTVAAGTHTITVGGSGSGTAPPAPSPTHPQIVGGDSLFGASSPYVITAKGGGAGLMDAATYPIDNALMNGGSGGGNGDEPAPGPDTYYGVATQPTQNPGIPTITNYGNNGFVPASGNAPADNNKNGGGGGAGSGNSPGSQDNLTGGEGQPFSNFPGPVLEPAIPADGPSTTWATVVGPTGLFGGGGGGGTGPTYSNGVGGPGGGGNAGSPGTNYTGGGAGGCNYPGTAGEADGGRGIVIIRYPT